MKIFIALSLLFFVAISICSGEITLTENGHSPYTVVIPADTPDKGMNHHNLIALETLLNIVKNASGTSLPWIKEGAKPVTGPAIYIGNTQALRSAGVNPDSFKRGEYQILVKDGNIFLAGHDFRHKVKTSYPNSHFYFDLGSLKAVTVFAEKFCNTRFTVPGEISSLPQKKLTVPKGFRYTFIPPFLFCTGTSGGAVYDVANNFRSSGWYGSYAGHSHDKAIPPERFFASHPEYFALRNGKRVKDVQYCLSNPEVRKLIYEEVLSHLDQGYEMAQLAQSDGFNPCHCQSCKELFGQKVTAMTNDFTAYRNDPAWGEKLWIMHREMAEQLLKDRPGKKVCIIAYGPTKTPPQTFREFPDNVMIELAPFSPEIAESWKLHKVKHGFLAYLYNWGNYKLEGFTPKMSLKSLSDQAKAFRAANIRGAYRCGFGELPGLEGPFYYAWGHQLDEPERDSGELLKEYCDYTYGKAARTMEQFFRLLDSRLALVSNRQLDWNDPGLLDGSKPALEGNLQLLKMRYPAEVLSQMETLLEQAEKEIDQPAGKFLFPLLKEEFTYLKLTATGVNAFVRFRETKSQKDFDELLDAVEARQKFAEALPIQKGTKPPRIAMKGLCRRFGYEEKSVFMAGGRLGAPLRVPFVWDTQWMRENKIRPAGREIETGGAPQLLVQKDFYPQHPEIAQMPVTIAVNYDPENFYATFRLAKTMLQECDNNPLQIMIGDKEHYYMLAGRLRNNSELGIYKRQKSSAENAGKGNTYKGIRNAGKLEASEADGGVIVRVAMPWKYLDFPVPSAGTKLHFNAGFQDRSAKVRRTWEYNLLQRSYRNVDDASGTLIFTLQPKEKK